MECIVLNAALISPKWVYVEKKINVSALLRKEAANKIKELWLAKNDMKLLKDAENKLEVAVKYMMPDLKLRYQSMVVL